MTIDAISTAIGEIGEELTEIKSSYGLAPKKLDTAELPALYPLTGSAEYSESLLGEHYLAETRTYRIQVAVLPIGQADANERESLCRPLLELVRNKFGSHPSLKNTERVQEANVVSDSGVVILPEWGASFVGFEVRLRVLSHILRMFAEGE